MKQIFNNISALMLFGFLITGCTEKVGNKNDATAEIATKELEDGYKMYLIIE